MTLHRPLQFTALALATLALGIPVGTAQTVQPSPGLPSSPVMAGRLGGGGAGSGGVSAPMEDTGPRMDFQFSGLPLAEAIKNIQASYRKVAAPKSLNVVVGEHLRELAETNTVTLDVKQITVGEVLNLIGMSSQRAITWWSFQRNMGATVEQQGKAGFSFIPVASSGGNPTYLLQSDYPAGYGLLKSSVGSSSGGVLAGAPPADSAPQKFVAYYPLENYLDRFKVEDITTAMKIGWDLSGTKGQPTMKFHEETKLLVVSGDQQQLQIVEKVLQGIEGAKGREGSPPQMLSPEMARRYGLRPNPVPAPAPGIPVNPGLPPPAAKP